MSRVKYSYQINYEKRLFAFVYATIFVVCVGTQNFSGKRITVPEPVLQFGTDSDNWITLFVQGQITTNLQNYSGMVVIDRQNLDKAKAEQKRSENIAYSETEQLSVGKLVAAQYIVVVQIIKKGKSYSLDAKVNDVETGTTVGKAYNNANCPAPRLEDGTEINTMSYTLLKGLGIADSKISPLLDTTKANQQKKEIEANTNLAKGIAAYSNGTIVEALAYYQKAASDSGLSEAADRLMNMTQDLGSGNIRESAMNELNLRKEWLMIWDDYRDFIKKNYYASVWYSTDIKRGKINYQNETLELSVPVSVIFETPEFESLYNSLYESYKIVANSGYDIEAWGLNTEKQTAKFGAINLTCSILDDAGKELSKTVLKIEEYDSGKIKDFVLHPKAEKITDYLSIKVSSDIPIQVTNDIGSIFATYIEKVGEWKSEENNTFVDFGAYPQTLKKDNVTITRIFTTYAGMAFYWGNDGEWYAKVIGTPYDDKSFFGNGKKVEKGTAYYFKLEPIKWRVITNNYNEKKLLLSDKILFAMKYSTENKNNYEQSDVRNFLNADFLNTAFTKKHQAYIVTTNVDNSANSTSDARGTLQQAMRFACRNTLDKVFLLSEKEATTPAYGFARYNDYTPGNSRIRESTDFAKASGSNNSWWLRSPQFDTFDAVRNIRRDGDGRYYSYVDRVGGVLPAISVAW